MDVLIEYVNGSGKGDPSLTANCPSYAANVNNIPLNPTLQHTYDVIQGFLTEMSILFPDQYIHLGGDEVRLNFVCC
jgi:N-acetyl-beta-hexosaminidase